MPLSTRRAARAQTRDFVTRLLKAPAFALLLLAVLALPGQVHAETFAEDAQAAAAKGSVKLNDIPAIKKFLKFFGAKKLGNLKLNNVKYDGGVLKADVKFININWRFTAYSGGTAKDTFMTFGPTSKVSFKKMFKKVPGIELMDILVFDDQMLAVAAADLEIDAGDLPSGARAEIDRFYEGGDGYSFEMPQGIQYFGALDLGEAKALNDAIKFLGGKSSKVQLTASLSGGILDAMLGGSLPTPELSMTASLPTFRPKIGGLIQLPANVQFSFNTTLSTEGASVGFTGNTDFKIGKQTVPMSLTESITLDKSGAPEIGIEMAIFEGEPWKKAFGLPFLTIEDYAMEMTADASGTMSLGTSGKTSIGGKRFSVATSAQIGTTTAGLPLPEEISLEIDDGPNKVGSLSLKDMLSIYRDLLKVSSGGNIKLPLDAVPDVAIVGTEKGKGPKIAINLEAGAKAGFDIAGALRLLGANVATVETAFMSPEEGLEINAFTKKIGFGPISLPTGKLEVVARLDRENGTIPPPRVKIRTEGLSLFGSKSTLDITMLLTSATMVANQDFGELFKFDFKAFAGIKEVKKIGDLAKADFYLASSLKSDPGKWIRTEGKKAVQSAFDGLKPGLNKAADDLKKAKAEVDKLNNEIGKMRETVKRERAGATRDIKSAEADVNKLQNDINNLNGKINTNKRKIKKCDQTMKVCWWQPFKTKCKHVPNYPARGVCEAGNTPWRTAIAALEVAKAGVVASKFTAEKTLQAIRAGITSFPIDADPRIVGLFTALHSAKIALTAAEETVKGVGSFADLLAKGVAAVGKADVFALENGAVRGSLSQGLKGEPVILDMNFRLLGKSYRNRFAFSLTDWKFNAKQFEVIALAAAVKTVVKLGKDAKIVPHVLLNEVEKLYLKRKAEVDAYVAIALEGGGVGSDEAYADAAMGKDIIVDQRVNAIKIRASKQAILAAREKVYGIKENVMQKNLDELLKANKWVRIAGAAMDVGSGAGGRTWVIGSNKEGSGFGIYRWDVGKWSKINGSAVRIDVDPAGNAWVVNNKHEIYNHDGKTWHRVPGGANDIGVGANGKVWVIGTNNEGGGYGIYRWDIGNWTKINGSAVRIDVDPAGNAWVVNKKNEIFSYTGKNWKKMPGLAKDVGIGGDGTVVVIGTDDSPYVWAGNTWKKMVGKAREVSVDRAGNPWVVNAGKAIYAWDQAAKQRPTTSTQKSIAQILPDNTYLFQMQHSKRCLDNSGSTNKGAQAHQWDCNAKNANQRWRVAYKDGTWFNLVNERTKMCLDIEGNSKNRGAKAHQWPCHKGANQRWRVEPRGGDWFAIVAKHSNKCLDLAEVKTNNGGKFHQWDCHYKGNQLFKLN
jgi:hypothetical protein